ncbi:MAG: DnaJ domain-containing protein [Firmicutes bacterium]|nr:DnaJ domain-containing protein [Bacillota bacterium]
MSYLMDYYRILQVHHEAGAEVIEAAYRRLSKMNHPDVNQNPTAMERMKQINRAYEVLRDKEQRQRYHRDWMRLVTGIEPNKQRMAIVHPTNPSYRAIDDYFHALLMGQWNQAYQQLTMDDQQRIPLSDFVNWKQEVARVFQLGSYALKLFRKYQDCQLAGQVYQEVREFSVHICDMQLITGQINEESISKYVVLDRNEWRVCLGYQDLKPIILKLRYVADQVQHVNPDKMLTEALLRIDGVTGMLSRQGLLEQLEQEALRNHRYQNPFSVAIIHVLPAKNTHGMLQDEHLHTCMKHVATCMRKVFRKTDRMGRWSESSFAVLLSETTSVGAQKALNKLADLFNDDTKPAYEVTAGCSDYINTSLEDTIRMAESNALLRRGTQWEKGYSNIVLTGHTV